MRGACVLGSRTAHALCTPRTQLTFFPPPFYAAVAHNHAGQPPSAPRPWQGPRADHGSAGESERLRCVLISSHGTKRVRMPRVQVCALQDALLFLTDAIVEELGAWPRAHSLHCTQARTHRDHVRACLLPGGCGRWHPARQRTRPGAVGRAGQHARAAAGRHGQAAGGGPQRPPHACYTSQRGPWPALNRCGPGPHGLHVCHAAAQMDRWQAAAALELHTLKHELQERAARQAERLEEQCRALGAQLQASRVEVQMLRNSVEGLQELTSADFPNEVLRRRLLDKPALERCISQVRAGPVLGHAGLSAPHAAAAARCDPMHIALIRGCCQPTTAGGPGRCAPARLRSSPGRGSGGGAHAGAVRGVMARAACIGLALPSVPARKHATCTRRCMHTPCR